MKCLSSLSRSLRVSRSTLSSTLGLKEQLICREDLKMVQSRHIISKLFGRDRSRKARKILDDGEDEFVDDDDAQSVGSNGFHSDKTMESKMKSDEESGYNDDEEHDPVLDLTPQEMRIEQLRWERLRRMNESMYNRLGKQTSIPPGAMTTGVSLQNVNDDKHSPKNPTDDEHVDPVTVLSSEVKFVGWARSKNRVLKYSSDLLLAGMPELIYQSRADGMLHGFRMFTFIALTGGLVLVPKVLFAYESMNIASKMIVAFFYTSSAILFPYQSYRVTRNYPSRVWLEPDLQHLSVERVTFFFSQRKETVRVADLELDPMLGVDRHVNFVTPNRKVRLALEAAEADHPVWMQIMEVKDSERARTEAELHSAGKNFQNIYNHF